MPNTYSSLDIEQALTVSQSRGAGKREKSVGVLPGDRPRYLRPAEAADYLSVGTSTLYRLIARKQIKVASLAGVRLIRTVDLDALVEANLR
jgi:excisionase family DNA binding protein